jgi:predicted outer membrane repeat protein
VGQHLSFALTFILYFRSCIPMESKIVAIYRSKDAVILAVLLSANISYATEINVTPGAVDDIINGNCSLIEAIRSANTDSAVDACPAGSGSDQLNLGGATYSLSVHNDTNYGYNATPCITSHISIIGGGALITRSSNSDFRLICVDNSGHLVLEDTRVTNGKVDGSSITYQRGGAILVRGRLDLGKVELSGNTAAQQGGALFVEGGTANISNSIFEGNSAVKGGAVRSDSNASVNIVGSAFNNNQADFGGATFFNNSVANINNSVIRNNSSAYQGGGLHYSGSSGSIISTNVNGNITGEKGAGVRIDNSSNVIISSSVIDGNHTTNYGGGGIYVILSNLALEKTTISNNTAGRGAGLYVDVAHIDVHNTTLSGNRAAVYGGGIYVDADENKALYNASITLKHATVSSNSASAGGGKGIWLNPISRATLVNSIVAKNGSRDCTVDPTALLQDNGGNWFGDDKCTGVANGDPKLWPLSNNGGPNNTHALLAGSPAIDQGILIDCLPTDQPGKSRPIGSSCEPGAYEFCFAISPTSNSFGQNGGSETVNITALCSEVWSALESLPWVSLSPTSGTGDGSVTVTVSANSGAPRSGSATIAGQRYSISQAAAVGWVPPDFPWTMFLPAITNNQ